MKITAILSAVAVALSLSATTAVSAEKKKPAAEAVKKEAPKPEAKKEAPKTDAKKDNYPLYGEVVSITDTTLTIKGGEGKENRKFVITKDTTIKKDDKPATTKDAKEGQWVGGYVKKGDGNDELVSLNLSAKQKVVKTEEKKTETKKTETKKTAPATPTKKKPL